MTTMVVYDGFYCLRVATTTKNEIKSNLISSLKSNIILRKAYHDWPRSGYRILRRWRRIRLYTLELGAYVFRSSFIYKHNTPFSPVDFRSRKWWFLPQLSGIYIIYIYSIYPLHLICIVLFWLHFRITSMWLIQIYTSHRTTMRYIVTYSQHNGSSVTYALSTQMPFRTANSSKIIYRYHIQYINCFFYTLLREPVSCGVFQRRREKR